MNTFELYHDLKKRGVVVEVAGENLKVDAPAGVLTAKDRAALREAKPALMRFIADSRRGPSDDGRRFNARPSRRPGYTSLYDPIERRWYDFPTKDCYPSVIALAKTGGRREAR